jgi:hypothetical protein
LYVASGTGNSSIDAEDFRRIAPSLEGAEEGSQHGRARFPGWEQDICGFSLP